MGFCLSVSVRLFSSLSLPLSLSPPLPPSLPPSLKHLLSTLGEGSEQLFWEANVLSSRRRTINFFIVYFTG